MVRVRHWLLRAVATTLVLAALPAMAHGAPSTPATLTAPLASGPLDAQIWPAQDGQTTAMIVAVSVDEKVKLPARVRIPVPNGAVVQWAGEIFNGDASADKQRDFTVHDGAGGGSYAEFTLLVSRRGQIDTNGIPMTANGNQLSTQVDWIQSVPSTSTLFTVRLPAGASDVRIDPAPDGPPDTNSAGEKLYLLASQTLATGSQSTVKVAYNTNPSGAAASAASSLTPVYIVLGVLLVAAFAVLAYLLARQNRSQATQSDSGRARRGDPHAKRGGGSRNSGASDPSADTDRDDDPFDIDFDDE